MTRRLQLDTEAPRVRSRQPPPSRLNSTSPEMVELARAAFRANKEANAASQRARAAQKDLAKLMTKADITEFTFAGPLPTGGEVQVRAAIEPYAVDVIDVNVLRTLVDDATFMRVVKATQGAVKEVCGEHVALKALTTEDRPAELKLKEVK